jgi:hypothetical protein
MKTKVTVNGENCTAQNFMISFYSPDIITASESKRIRWMGHVARMGGGQVYRAFCL